MPRNLRSSGKSATATPVAAGLSSTKTTKKQRGQQTKRSKSKSADGDMTDAKSLRLPSDAVSSAFLYLDVDGVPKAAVMCKEWNAILKSVEEELWLSLVRKHCPIAERIARKLPPPAIASSTDDDDEEEGDGGGQEPPAKRGRLAIDWKDQFRRAREMSKQKKIPSPEPTTSARPEPKPLSSYFFQVDLILHKGVKGKLKSEWGNPGIVSTIVDGDNLKFNDNGRIELCVKSEDVADELSKYSFTSFDIKLVLFDKATGKRAFFYQGGVEEECDFNYYLFETSLVTRDVYENKFSAMDGQILDAESNPAIACELIVSKNGCLCTCHNGEDWDLFKLPASCPCCYCNCCSCKREGKGSKWSCFWGMDIQLSLEIYWNFYNFDISEIDGEREQLEVLEGAKFV